MTGEQFHREQAYQVTLAIARSMLRGRLITEDEYRNIGAMMLEKYRPLIGSLYCC